MKDENRQEQEGQKQLELNEEQRRDFIKKFGSLAAVTPVALAALMSDARASGFSDSAGF